MNSTVKTTCNNHEQYGQNNVYNNHEQYGQNNV